MSHNMLKADILPVIVLPGNTRLQPKIKRPVKPLERNPRHLDVSSVLPVNLQSEAPRMAPVDTIRIIGDTNAG